MRSQWSLLEGNEEEILGNIYAGGVQDTSSLYYVTLVPLDQPTASRLVGTFDSLMYQTHGRAYAFGWFDPAETDSDQCGDLETYLDPQTSDSARGSEIHASEPGIIGSGHEGHCVRPGRYRISLWIDGVSQPLRTYEIDYVQTGSSTHDTTPGAPSPVIVVETPVYDPEWDGLIDNLFHFDLTAGAFTDSAVLQIDTARANVTAKPFRDDESPSGLHTDWFRFGAQRSTSTWVRPGSATGPYTLQGKLFFDYARQAELATGYFTTFPATSGAPVARVFSYADVMLGDTSALIEVGLATKRPDEISADVPDVIRTIEVIVGSPEEPPDTAINHFAMPQGVLERIYSWKMADQHLNGLAAETGPNRTYSFRFNQGSWLPAPNAIFDFEGFASAGTNAMTLSVYNSAIDSTHFYVGTVETYDSTMYFTGEQYITVKTMYTYTSNTAGIWAERDSFPEAWGNWLEPATDTYDRIWAGGEYVLDLRVQDTTASVLRRGRMQITVCTVSQSCTEAFLMASSQEQRSHVLFGGGPTLSWGTSAAPMAVRYYELTGRHDGNTPFRERSWIDAEGGVESQRLEGGSITWAVDRNDSAGVRTADFAVTAPAGQAYVFGLSLDPDLGWNAADDQSGYDPSTGLLYVFDGDEAAGFMLRRDGADALASVSQYGARHPPPVSRADVWTVQRRNGVHLVNGEQDVQFVMSAAQLTGTREFTLVMLRAESPAALLEAAASYLATP